MDKEFENLTLHLHELKYNCPILEKAPLLSFAPYLPYMPKAIYEEALQLQELVTIGFCTESELQELHSKYRHGYGEIFLLAKKGYSYEQIKEMFDREVSKQFKNSATFPKYKISGGTIKGNLRKPKFDLKIERI